MLLMLDVYPAGEAPIPGADSRLYVVRFVIGEKIDPILVSDPARGCDNVSAGADG